MIVKDKIDVMAYANQILSSIPKGALLTTSAGKITDTMTIGWGSLGTNWARSIFTAYIGRQRFTMDLLNRNPEFTVNLSVGKFAKKILGICGSVHGNEINKIEKAGLTLVPSDEISVPGLLELPLTLECKVLYQQLQQLDLYPSAIREKFYPQDIPGTATAFNREPHFTIMGEIVKAYIIRETTD